MKKNSSIPIFILFIIRIGESGFFIDVMNVARSARAGLVGFDGPRGQDCSSFSVVNMPTRDFNISLAA